MIVAPNMPRATEEWNQITWKMSMKTEARHLSGTQLATALRDSRQRTLALVMDLSEAQWQPVKQIGINPIAWELAHIAWFAEFWILRGPHNRDELGFAHAHKAPRFAGPDTLFDSARLAHAARWTETMPTRVELTTLLTNQLEACIAAIPDTIQLSHLQSEDEALYFHRLALFHEDMHGEAFCWMRAALGYAAPEYMTMPKVPVSISLSIDSDETKIGIDQIASGFSFDNECPASRKILSNYQIDSAPLSAREFAKFVDDNGYEKPQFWPGEAGAWRAQSNCTHPQRWRLGSSGDWQTRWFERWLPLDPNSAAIHLNAFEAQAYCLWAGRRLPSAAEWEHAAETHPAFSWGHSVWEWTSDAFAPYPGFEAGPYREYSQPWFGNHRELRGGAFATHQRMHHPRYRNFFQAHRNDVFAGFRTVAISADT
jgi:ergothioneine biosynthesis protein EgtB